MHQSEPRSRPAVMVVLAMSVDGKIADRDRAPARFGSTTDRHHLETQLATADATLFGGGTLRAYGTSLLIRDSTLLAARQQRGQSPQPIHIVCSRRGIFDPKLRFFQQPVPRWLLTTSNGATHWHHAAGFDQVLALETATGEIDWQRVWPTLRSQGIERLVVMGGSELVATLVAQDCVDEVWVTVCPLLLGGQSAPTLMAGPGFPEALAPRLQLVAVRSQADEVFLHYQVNRSRNNQSDAETVYYAI